MGGRPGRSGGHNRLSLEAHVLRGTFNPTRHAHLITPGPAWDPAPALLEALGPAGRALVARLRAAYDLSAIEGELALEGAHAEDRLAALRTRLAWVAAKDRRVLERLEQTWQKAKTTCLERLRARVDRQPTTQPTKAPVSKWGGRL